MPTQHIFKVGDRVRCVDASQYSGELIAGREYEVTELHSFEREPPYVRLRGVLQLWCESRFVLVSRPDEIASGFVWNFGVYVAGPMYSSGDLVTNARRAIDAAHRLYNAGIDGVTFHCFVPQVHALTRELVHTRTGAAWQAEDDFWLRACKFVLRLPGHSVGGDHETALAKELGIPVFGTVEELIAHVHETYGAQLERRNCIPKREAKTGPIEAGDIVVCVDAQPCTLFSAPARSKLEYGKTYVVSRKNNFASANEVLLEGMSEHSWFASRFRHATPDEVVAHGLRLRHKANFDPGL